MDKIFHGSKKTYVGTMNKEEQLKILVTRIQAQPGLEERIESILDIMENKSGEFITADEAEQKAIEEIQKLGQELLRGWALNQQNQAVKTAEQTHKNAKKHGKKTLLANKIRKNRNRRSDNEGFRRGFKAIFSECQS